MIEDLRRSPEGRLFEADVCIVGAGPAGVALARALSGSGLRILLVESGGLAIEPAVQSLNVAETTGLPHHGAVEGRARALGGAGRLWAGQCLRLDRLDFTRRAWIPDSGWPIACDLLEPHYEAAERFFKVEGLATDRSVYAQFGQQAPAWQDGTLDSMFTVYTPEIDVGRHHVAALRRATDLQVLLHANVVRIDVSDDTDAAVSCLQLRTLDGRTARARARAYVLCGGGIENARLLLASDRQRAAGLGNARDLVGRYFQDHPNGMTATLEGGDAGSLQARFRMLYGRHRYFPKFRLSPDRQAADKASNATAHLVFEEEGDAGLAALRAFVSAGRRRRLPPRPLSEALRLARGADAVGRVALARLRGVSAGRPTAIRLQCHLEQAPDRDSRIRLSREVDALGLRRAAIDWRLGAQERHTAQVLTRVVGAEFARLGLGTLVEADWLGGADWRSHLSDAYHHAGTTRMASDASVGVVDTDLRVFELRNLFVCGGSVFPTSGYANPTLTIVALALRLSAHLRDRLAAPRAHDDTPAPAADASCAA